MVYENLTVEPAATLQFQTSPEGYCTLTMTNISHSALIVQLNEALTEERW